VIGDILQPTHLIFVLVVALLVLGPKRLPEVGRALGRGLRDFRNAVSGIDHGEGSDPAVVSAPEHSATTPATEPAMVSAPEHSATTPATKPPEHSATTPATKPADHASAPEPPAPAEQPEHVG
jgi:sec-independent protein translocase protein TatA